LGSFSGSSGADSFVLCGLLGSFREIVLFDVARGEVGKRSCGISGDFPGVGSCPMLGSVRLAKTLFEKTLFRFMKTLLRAMRSREDSDADMGQFAFFDKTKSCERGTPMVQEVARATAVERPSRAFSAKEGCERSSLLPAGQPRQGGLHRKNALIAI